MRTNAFVGRRETRLVKVGLFREGAAYSSDDDVGGVVSRPDALLQGMLLDQRRQEPLGGRTWPTSTVNSVPQWAHPPLSDTHTHPSPSIPPTKASPAPFVSTMWFWSMSRTGNIVTLSPANETQKKVQLDCITTLEAHGDTSSVCQNKSQVFKKKKNQIHVKWHVRLFVYKWHNPTFFCHPEVRPCEILAKMSADATIRLAEAKIYVKTHNNATQRSRINTKKSHCIRSQALRINHTANLGVLFACSFLSWHMGR